MSFNITVQDVQGPHKVKTYEELTVVYTFKGANKEQVLRSFANPQVFKAIQGMVGKNVVVETTKNAKGYDQWSKVTLASEAGAVGSAPPPTGKVVGSNYETAEERKLRQMYIIKQSSISNAVEALSVGAKAPLKTSDVLAVAQDFVDWVYGNDVLAEGSEGLEENP